MRRIFLSLALLALVFLTTSRAHAQFRIEEEQSSSWYGQHGAALGLLTIGSLAVLIDSEEALYPRWRKAPAFEENTKRNLSPFSARASDVSRLTSVVLPLGTTYLARSGASYGNSLIIYGQSMGLSLFVNTVTKKVAMRARPYTHREDFEHTSSNDYHSFYSGHSALTFTAATSGSTLFRAVENDASLRSAHWGATIALASFTAMARVRAGRHYPTDVLVGSAIGAAFGLATSSAHGISLDLSPQELAATGIGVVTGTLAASFLPRETAKKAVAWAPRLIPTERGLFLLTSGHF